MRTPPAPTENDERDHKSKGIPEKAFLEARDFPAKVVAETDEERHERKAERACDDTGDPLPAIAGDHHVTGGTPTDAR